MLTDGEGGGAPGDLGGITRRQALKRGAILGGALVWATPVVQVVGMRPALASVPSGLCPFILGNLCFLVPQEICDTFEACFLIGGGDFFVCLAEAFDGADPGSFDPCTV